MQTNQYQEAKKHYQNVYFECFWACYLQKKKNAKKLYKTLYIGKQMDIARKVYNECFIVKKKKNTRQKSQKLVYMEKFPRYQNAETHK